MPKLAPTVALTIGDTLYTLLLDLNAVEEIHGATGKNLLAGENPLDTGHPSHFKATVAALLRHHHPQMDAKTVGAMLGPWNFATISTAILELFSANFQQPEGADQDPNPASPKANQ